MYVLLLLIFTIGCINEEDSDRPIAESQETNKTEENGEWAEITAILLNENVHSFFREKIHNAYNALGYQAKDGFLIKENTCCRIDSREEFASLYQGSDELPEIDFSKYTLLLGAKIFTDADTDLENYKLSLFESTESYKLDICSRHLEGSWSSFGITLQILYYGLYPKLKNKDIVVNLLYE